MRQPGRLAFVFSPARRPLGAITLSALAAVPAMVIFRQVTASRSRQEHVPLVIDLQNGDADLEPALALALDDPSLQLLTSPDGESLVDGAGRTIAADDPGDGLVLTPIHAAGKLIGGLIHSPRLRRKPDRLEAVAIATGSVLRSTQRDLDVVTQLDDVDASRARILLASDTARCRVQRQLHDGAQQRLVAHGLCLQRARRMARSVDHDEMVALLDDATRDVRKTIDEIRAVTHGAQPALLAERGLGPAIDALAEQAPVPVHVDIARKPLPANAERTAYYVIAEGLTNMAKHAAARTAHVSITSNAEEACVTVRDDGQGGAEISQGSGLEGLSDRIAASGGTFTLSSGPEGTTLRATIPCG